MSNYYFIGNYKNENSLYKTLRFIDLFTHELKDKLIKRYHLLPVNLPQVVSFSMVNNPRLVNFDNRFNNGVYQYNSDHRLYQCQIMYDLRQETKLGGIISEYESNIRDTKVGNTVSYNEQIIDCCIKVTLVEKINNEDLLIEWSVALYQMINEIFDYLKQELGLSSSYLPLDMTNVSISKYLKKLHTLKIDDYIQQVVSNKKLVLATNLETAESAYFPHLNPVTDDLDKSAVLLYWYDKISEIIPLFSLNFLNTEDNSKKQIKNAGLKIENYQNDLDRIHKLSDEIHIKINVSRCCMALLNKLHIGEVCPGCWDKELLKEALEKGIKIL